MSHVSPYASTANNLSRLLSPESRSLICTVECASQLYLPLCIPARINQPVKLSPSRLGFRTLWPVLPCLSCLLHLHRPNSGWTWLPSGALSTSVWPSRVFVFGVRFLSSWVSGPARSALASSVLALPVSCQASACVPASSCLPFRRRLRVCIAVLSGRSPFPPRAVVVFCVSPGAVSRLTRCRNCLCPSPACSICLTVGGHACALVLLRTVRLQLRPTLGILCHSADSRLHCWCSRAAVPFLLGPSLSSACLPGPYLG